MAALRDSCVGLASTVLLGSRFAPVLNLVDTEVAVVQVVNRNIGCPRPHYKPRISFAHCRIPSFDAVLLVWFVVGSGVRASCMCHVISGRLQLHLLTGSPEPMNHCDSGYAASAVQ